MNDIINAFREKYGTLTANKVSTQTRYRIREEETTVVEMLKIVYSANVSRSGCAIVKDDETIKKLRWMAWWLTNTKAKPGMMLYGTCGNGKTTLAESAKDVINTLLNPENSPYTICPGVPQVLRVSALKLAQSYTESKSDYDKWKNTPMLMIDDLGIEPAEIKIYGNVVSPMVELIYERYDRRLLTIITSNLTQKDIGGTYGPRVIERIIEMCNMLAFTHKSYRR